MENKISATIITFNEEKNIEATLQALDFAHEIIVIDSHSHDRTVEICKKYGAKVHDHPFKNYGDQKNVAAKYCQGPWILNVDADEIISPELKSEILETLKSRSFDQLPPVFQIPRVNYFYNRPMYYGGNYPDHNKRLYKRDQACWTTPEVHEVLNPIDPNATIQSFQHPIHHYTCNDIETHLRTNLKYAQLKAKQMIKEGKTQGLLFKMIFAPWIKFFELYIVKRGVLDGVIGLVLAINSMFSIYLRYFLMYLYTSNKSPNQPQRN